MNDKKNIAIISLIFAAGASLMFLIAIPNTLFIIAYAFVMAGIVILMATGYMIVGHKDRYPWFAALPMQAFTYLIICLAISAAAVILDQTGLWTAPWKWFTVIQSLLLGFFIIKFIVINGAAQHIDASGAKAKTKTDYIKRAQYEIDALNAEVKDAKLKAKLRALSEQIRFSDPMSTGDAAILEEQILNKITELKYAAADIPKAMEAADEIGRLFEKRNRLSRITK